MKTKEELEREAHHNRVHWKARRLVDVMLTRPLYFKDGRQMELRSHGGGIYWVSVDGAQPYQLVAHSLSDLWNDVDWLRTDS